MGYQIHNKYNKNYNKYFLLLPERVVVSRLKAIGEPLQPDAFPPKSGQQQRTRIKQPLWLTLSGHARLGLAVGRNAPLPFLVLAFSSQNQAPSDDRDGLELNSAGNSTPLFLCSQNKWPMKNWVNSFYLISTTSRDSVQYLKRNTHCYWKETSRPHDINWIIWLKL